MKGNNLKNKLIQESAICKFLEEISSPLSFDSKSLLECIRSSIIRVTNRLESTIPKNPFENLDLRPGTAISQSRLSKIPA